MNTNEHDQIRAAISKTVAETMKIMEEGSKIRAETMKLEAEHRHYLKIALATLAVSALGAMGAIIAAVIKMVS